MSRTHSSGRLGSAETEPAEGGSRDFDYIETSSHLGAWVSDIEARLKATGDHRISIDTEADSLHHYNEKLCLIQIACAGRFALVDPLAVEDMRPLLDLLDACEVWLHGADYDLTMLRRTYGFGPRVVRDTQIAARLLGHRQFGLAALVESVFDARLSKTSQKADWSRRPLPDVMLRYAVDDVRYLLPLADRLLAGLHEKDRMSWFVQSCEALQRDVAVRSMDGREEPWRVQGAGRLQPKGLALLKAMWEWREGVAAERDVPCFKVMSNKQMVAFAEDFEAGRAPVAPRGWRPRWKKDFHDILTAVAGSEPKTWPARLRRHKGRLSDRARDEIESLCKLRDSVAAGLDLESSLLGSRATLEGVVAAEEGLHNLLPWQQELLRPGLERVRELLQASPGQGGNGY